MLLVCMHLLHGGYRQANIHFIIQKKISIRSLIKVSYNFPNVPNIYIRQFNIFNVIRFLNT